MIVVNGEKEAEDLEVDAFLVGVDLAVGLASIKVSPELVSKNILLDPVDEPVVGVLQALVLEVEGADAINKVRL